MLPLLALITAVAQPAPSAVPASEHVAPVPPAAPSPTTTTVTAAPAPSAVIEHSIAATVVQRDGTFVTTRAVVVRVDREDAVRGASTVPIPVSTSLQRFELVEAWTETPDGRRVDVAPASVITQAPPYAAQMATLSDIQLKVINFPAVGVGARLHLTTRIHQTTPNFPGVFTLEMAVGTGTTLLDGQLTLDLPAAMPLHIDMAGMTAAAPRVEGDRRIYAWRYAMTSYRPPQPNALSPLDRSPRLIATTLPDWAGLARAYQDRATPMEQPSARIRALADQLTRGLAGDRARAAALATWVQRNIRYVNIVLGVGGFVPAPADEVLATRYGDCKGHVTLLNALLAAAGIPSTAVLINAGPTFREPTVAGQVFNHLINYLPGLDLFVDTTNPFAPLGELPPVDRAKFVVLTRSGVGRRTPLNGPEPDGFRSEFALQVLPDGGIDGTSTVVPSGTYVGELRALAVAMRGRNPADAAAALMRANASPGTGSLTLPDPAAPAAAIRLAGSWHLDDAVAGSTGGLKLPYAVSLGTIGGIAAEGLGPPRSEPTMCSSLSLDERFTVRFPADVTILALPAAAKVETAEIRYASTWQRDGQAVTVTRRYVSRYPERICSAAVQLSVQQAKRLIARDVAGQIIYARR